MTGVFGDEFLWGFLGFGWFLFFFFPPESDILQYYAKVEVLNAWVCSVLCCSLHYDGIA